MTDLRALAESATMRPWIREWGAMTVKAFTGHALETQADVDFVVALANQADALLDLVDAARRLADDTEAMNGPVLAAISTMTKLRSYVDVRDALDRLSK